MTGDERRNKQDECEKLRKDRKEPGRSDHDMQKIQALDEAESAFFSHYDPETVEFLASFGK